MTSFKSELEGRLGTTFALSNGLLGLRGHHEEMPSWGRPEFYVAGTYTGGPASLLGFHDADHILTHPKRITPEFLASVSGDAVSTLPNLPNPLAVRLSVGGEPVSFEGSKVLACERVLEMDQASLRRCVVFRDAAGRRTRVDSRRLVSFADRNLICLQYVVTPLDHDAPIDVEAYLKTDVTNTNGVVLWHAGRTLEGPGLRAMECITDESAIGVAIAQQARVRRGQVGEPVVLELCVIAGEMDLDQAVARTRAAAGTPFEEHLARHVAAYALQRDAAAVEFDDNPATVQGFNFGQMHMHMAYCYDDPRVGIPIKGLTGHGYRFANFWDMDFHMFPYYLLTKPRQARRLLEYRFGQLDAYRVNARRWGYAGAQVPWETQRSGQEVTAPWLCLQERELHISADAAYMFGLYDELTGDHDAMVTMGAEFIFETARFYASRVTLNEAAGRYELRDIGCPDQYHTFADNNVFISLMARWNLQYASQVAAREEHRETLARLGVTAAEVARWGDIAARFYVHGPAERAPGAPAGIIEEFDGYFQLAPDLEGIAETYCRHSQAVKQPDVLAAFWPFEELYDRDTRQRNWLYYAARTTHGSSLSLPGMAHSAARCGLNDEALYFLHKSCRMDLDDVNLDTERGVHVSGGALQWYTVVFGFGGLSPRADGLHFEPNLPRQWSRLRFAAHWQFQRLDVTLTRGELRLEAPAGNDRPVAAFVRGQPVTVPPGSVVQMDLGDADRPAGVTEITF